MQTVHAGLSIAAVISPGKKEAVDRILRELNPDPAYGNATNNKLPLTKSLTTHLVSASVLPELEYHGTTFPATLLFMTSYAGPDNDHLDELIRIGAAGLGELFSNCTGFPADGLTSAASLKSYIKKHRLRDTFYTGMQYLTPTDVLGENKLRIAIESYIDQQQKSDDFNKLSPAEVKKKIQSQISSLPEFSWAKEIPKRTFADFWTLWGGATGVIFGLFIALPAILAWVWPLSCCTNCGLISGLIYFACIVLAILIFAGVLLILYRVNELKKQDVAKRQEDDNVRRVLSTQNHPVMNEMTICGPLKPGWIHTFTYNFVLRVVPLVRGALNIPSISTARWLTTDNGRRLVFISCFENLSESYVRDFIDSTASAIGINVLFGQGNGYPATKWIKGNGCITDPDAFLNDVHQYQLVTQLWYWPYMDLSIDNINNNHQIRLGLFSTGTDKQAAAWLKLL